MEAENILNELNESQRHAVECTDGAVMVIAGAGSGKTRVLTYRIAHMIAHGIDPFNILSLTFTNKAAEEMKERVMSLLGDTSGRNVWMGTFHSIFNKILRIESHWLNHSPNFIIYDSSDTKSLLRAILKEKQLDANVYKPTMLASKISSAKASLVSPEEYCNNEIITLENKQKGIPEMGNIYRFYNHRLKQSDAMDFDDLLVNMYVLLRDFPNILYKYQHKFKYILVDEYQDTNYAQYQIIKKLAAVHENICVVGDDAQSIYSFRGANIHNILNFKDDYKDYHLFKLEQNYRSTQHIIEAANSVIRHNKNQIPKHIWTANALGEKIKVIQTTDENEEALAVVNSIVENKRKHKLKNKDFTILYRTNAQSRAFEEVLRQMDLPYRIYGGMSFYDRKEIKDVLAYFRIVCNPSDNEALRRIINYPSRGIGSTTIERLLAAAAENNTFVWNVISNPLDYDLKFGTAILNILDNFATKIKSFQAELQTRNAFELGKHIADSTGITQDLLQNTEEKERYENLGELFNALKDFVERPPQYEIDMETGEEISQVFPSLAQFLNEIVLYTDADRTDKDDNNKIKLMTMHSAKGLEFPFVYIAGLEESLMPFYLISSQDDLEEERRLFYVALTRAEQSVTLSLALRRRVFGNYKFSQPSSFLREIDPRLLETVIAKSAESNKFPPKPNYSRYEKTSVPPVVRYKTTLSRPPVISTKKAKSVEINPKLKLGEIALLPSQLTHGMRVCHAKFGEGVIQKIIESENKAVIKFEAVGEKTMLLQFAKLRLVL
ncbi:MAG: UvrD-helicase domain-containing protein [Lentimicrobiaceae bacterium]|nr:UvrD-helicase domain-containing protein [Lentimicrobiaceae bacterium]